MEIILLACNTGKDPGNGDKIFGQQLVDALADKDVIVKAPDKYIHPVRYDSFGPGYELSSDGVISSRDDVEPRRLKVFTYKPQQEE